MFNHDHGVAPFHQPVQHGEQAIHVLEVQARGGFIQDVERAPGGALAEFLGELDALGFPPGKGGGGLPHADVTEADIKERHQLAVDLGDGREEFGGFLNRHLQHVGDGLALVAHFQRFAVVALALAQLARHVDVRQKVHLDLDDAVAPAGFAAAALHVERETPLGVAAHLGIGGHGEQSPDEVEGAGVGGRVAARGAPDGRLINVNHLVELVHAPDFAVVFPRTTRAK